MILAERDESGAFTAAADGVLEKRRYYGQNWRSDTAMVATDTGKLVENVKYFSNGVGKRYHVADTDGDGDWDATDAAAITGAYDVLKDADMDGDVDSNDITQANAFGGYTSTPLGTISIVENRKGYAGYELEPNLNGSKFHVRHRVLDGELGRWTRRDPLEERDILEMYGYANCDPSTNADPYGLAPVDLKLALHRFQSNRCCTAQPEAWWKIYLTQATGCTASDKVYLVQKMWYTGFWNGCNATTPTLIDPAGTAGLPFWEVFELKRDKLPTANSTYPFYTQKKDEFRFGPEPFTSCSNSSLSSTNAPRIHGELGIVCGAATVTDPPAKHNWKEASDRLKGITDGAIAVYTTPPTWWAGVSTTYHELRATWATCPYQGQRFKYSQAIGQSSNDEDVHTVIDLPDCY